MKFFLKFRIIHNLQVTALQFLHIAVKHLRYIGPAKMPIVTKYIWLLVSAFIFSQWNCSVYHCSLLLKTLSEPGLIGLFGFEKYTIKSYHFFSQQIRVSTAKISNPTIFQTY